jgi:hypothetical protein
MEIVNRVRRGRDAMRCGSQGQGSGSGGAWDRSRGAMHDVGRRTWRRSRQQQEGETDGSARRSKRGSDGLGLFWEGGGSENN